MADISNIRTLRPLPPVSAEPCSMCGSRLDVVLCSFAFERVHRRVALCREHRQPLLEIDHFTRPVNSDVEDVPAAWATSPQQRARASMWARRPSRRASNGGELASIVLLPVR